MSRRAYPAAQLRQKLEQDFPEDCVQEVLERVEELGLIDDADYALRCAKDLINIKHYSLQRVRQELRHRGIHDNDIEDAMQEFEDFDEQQAVQQLLEKKFAAALTEEKGRRRAFQALLRLGYDAGTVKSQMQRRWSSWNRRRSRNSLLTRRRKFGRCCSKNTGKIWRTQRGSNVPSVR